MPVLFKLEVNCYRTFTPRRNRVELLLGPERNNIDLSLFRAVYDSTGNDFARTLDILKASANTADPIAYLQAVVK